MTNFLEQHHTRPRLVAVVGGRRRPAPAVSAIRNRPLRAVTRDGRDFADLAESRRGAGHDRGRDQLTAA